MHDCVCVLAGIGWRQVRHDVCVYHQETGGGKGGERVDTCSVSETKSSLMMDTIQLTAHDKENRFT